MQQQYMPHVFHDAANPESNLAMRLRLGRGAALLTAAVEDVAAERRSLRVECRMAENCPDDARGKLRYYRNRKGRHGLVGAEQGTPARLKCQARRASFGLRCCAMVLAIAAATRRQFPVSKAGKGVRAEQRNAEHYDQQGCPDATH
jgi:hypothetical protein